GAVEQGGVGAAAAEAHDVRHRPPPPDDPLGGQDPGGRAGRDRRARAPPRALRTRRPIPAAARPPVPLRGGALRQSRRGAARLARSPRMARTLEYRIGVPPHFADALTPAARAALAAASPPQ